MVSKEVQFTAIKGLNCKSMKHIYATNYNIVIPKQFLHTLDINHSKEIGQINSITKKIYFSNLFQECKIASRSATER